MNDVLQKTLNTALSEIQKICNEPLSRSQLFLPRSQGHLNAIRHFYESSSQDAFVAVEPGSAVDLAAIVKSIEKAIKVNNKVHFAIKGGGHATNPGFSSTPGIQISLSRFNRISLDDTLINREGDKRLTVGAGCVFDEIYRYILPRNYSIVGGGGSVGIAGWILGGGYSLKSGEHGLGIDNLLQAEVVLPGGKVVKASAKENTDLFWAIKGGGNNFGIVTEFVLKAHKQEEKVYGGILSFDKPRVGRVKQAIIKFVKANRAKASIVAAFRFYQNHGIQEFKFTVLAYYDQAKPEDPKDDPFKDLLAIPHHGQITELLYPKWTERVGSFDRLTESSYGRLENAWPLLYDHIPANIAISLYNHDPADVADVADSLYNVHIVNNNLPVATSLYDNNKIAAEVHSPNNPAVNNAPRPFPAGLAGLGVMNGRARWGNVMVSKYTQTLIDVVEEEGKAAKRLMEKYKGRMVVADIWPLRQTMVDKATDSAWPHGNGKLNGPLLVYFMWEGWENDGVWIEQMKMALDHIHRVAIQERCTTDDAPVYCNTTLKDVTTPEKIYRNHLADLGALRTKFDPDEIMTRTGGFRIPSGPALVEGDYTIQNGEQTIGVDELPGPVKGGNTTFHIMPVADSTRYVFSATSHNARYVAVQHGNEVWCKPQELSMWELIPKARENNQLEFWIQQGSKRWVMLQGGRVQLAEAEGKEALWRFNLRNL